MRPSIPTPASRRNRLPRLVVCTWAAGCILAVASLGCGARAAAQATDPAQANPPAQPGTQNDIPRSQTPTPPPIPLQLNTHFTGEWTGVLDTGTLGPGSSVPSNAHLPALLSMRPSPDGRAINFSFTYNQGQGKTLRERTILAFTANTALLTGTGQAEDQAFQVRGLDTFRPTGYGTLVLTGPGMQNDQPVDVREILTLDPGEFTWLTETRPTGSGAAFALRSRYTFTRTAAAPGASMP